MKRSQTIKTWILSIALTASFSLGQLALAQVGLGVPPGPVVPPSGLDLQCDTNSLEGVYSVRGSVFFVPPDASVPFTTGEAFPASFQNITIFNGLGALTTPTGVGSNGGLPPDLGITATGTYIVNPDCTGELHIQSTPMPGSAAPPEVTAWITVINKDKFVFTFIDPFVTGSGTGELVGNLP